MRAVPDCENDRSRLARLSALVVGLHGIEEGGQEIRQGGFDAVPGGGDRVAGRIEKAVGGGNTDRTGEGGHRKLLLLAVIAQAVDFGVGSREPHRRPGHAVVGNGHRVKNFAVELYALVGECAKDAPGDIAGHFVESLAGIIGREFAVLVVVAVRHVNLAKISMRTDAEYFCQHAGFDSPVARHPHLPDDVKIEACLAAERVAERIQECQKFVRPDDLLQRADQRREEQAHDTPIEPVGKSRAVAFAKIESQAGMGDRVAEPGEQFSAIGVDVAIVRHNHPGAAARKDRSEAHPQVPAFSVRPRIQAGFGESPDQPRHFWSVVPDHQRPLRKRSEKLFRLEPGGRIGPVHADDDLCEVADVLQFADDPAQGRRAEFIRVAGQDESDRFCCGKFLQLALEPGDVRSAETVQRRHRAVLEKIRHRPSLRQLGVLFNTKRFVSVPGMPTEHAQELVVVHYHFRPGGVRRVLELLLPELAKRFGKITLVGGERPDANWSRAIKSKIPRLKFVIAPAFQYFEACSPDRTRDEIRAVLRREAGPDAVIWAHNLSLGRNMILADELAIHSARTGVRLISHHHDFWCDQRWARWPEMRAQGFSTLARAASAAFAADARVLHAGISSSDVRLLSRHMNCTARLPNPAGGEARPGKSAVACAKRWLRQELDDSAPVWIYPARFLRRKNFAEAVLLARWLAPEAWLVTTGGVSSPGEAAYAGQLESAAKKGRWRVRFGILARRKVRSPSIPELLCAAESIVMTSIQEGFGFPYLDGSELGCSLIARRLPAIQPDLEAFGISIPGLYDEVLIPPGLFDASAELQRQRSLFRNWKSLLPASCRALAGTPRFLIEPHRPVSFSRLTFAAQLEELAVSPRESLAVCAALNPMIESLSSGHRTECHGGSLISPAACAKRFFEHIEAFPRQRPSGLQARDTQMNIIQERLGQKFLFPLLMQG